MRDGYAVAIFTTTDFSPDLPRTFYVGILVVMLGRDNVMESKQEMIYDDYDFL